MGTNIKDFSSQKEIICRKQKKTLAECKETLKLLLEENESYNSYILLGRVFELYEQGAREEHADWYFYKYLKSLKTKEKYTFHIGENEFPVQIDIFNPFVEIKFENERKQIIDPQWHLIISYYAYIDAMYNHDDNEYARKIKEMPGHPTGRFGIRCNSLRKWLEEAF